MRTIKSNFLSLIKTRYYFGQPIVLQFGFGNACHFHKMLEQQESYSLVENLLLMPFCHSNLPLVSPIISQSFYWRFAIPATIGVRKQYQHTPWRNTNQGLYSCHLLFRTTKSSNNGCWFGVVPAFATRHASG